MSRFLKWLIGAAAASLMAIAGTSPEEAGSNIAAWAKVFGWDSPPPWLTVSSADTWVFWIGAVCLLALFIGITVPWILRVLRKPQSPDMTARQAIEWIALESKWAWGKCLLYYSLEKAVRHVKVWGGAPMVFDRAARDGDISVRGHGYNSAIYQVLDRDYWNTVGLDVLDILNPLGSDGRTQPKKFVDVEAFCDLRVGRQQVVKTWPRAGRIFRSYVRSRISLKAWSMAIGKYLNISEARKTRKLERFANEHPSTGEEDKFDMLLDRMVRKPESEDQTSDSSRPDED